MLQDMNYATSLLPIPYKEWRIRPAWRWFCSKQAGKGSDIKDLNIQEPGLVAIGMGIAAVCVATAYAKYLRKDIR